MERINSVKMTTTKAIYRFSAIPIKLKRMKYKHTRGKKSNYKYSLKSWSRIPPVLFFFLKIALALQGLLCFHTYFS